MTVCRTTTSAGCSMLEVPAQQLFPARKQTSKQAVCEASLGSTSCTCAQIFRTQATWAVCTVSIAHVGRCDNVTYNSHLMQAAGQPACNSSQNGEGVPVRGCGAEGPLTGEQHANYTVASRGPFPKRRQMPTTQQNACMSRLWICGPAEWMLNACVL